MRYKVEGVDGLYDRLTWGRPPPLTEEETASLSARIFRGADAETDGVSSWTLPDLRRSIEDSLDKRLRPQRLSSILRREGFSRQRSHDGNCREGSFAPKLLGSGRGAEPLPASR